MKKKQFLVGCALGLSLAAPAAQAVPVGLELVLLVDVSGSVNSTEYNLQKTGYVQAFQSAAVQSAILNSQGAGIAVTYAEWSGSGQFSVEVGWTLINSVASANAFAVAINSASRNFSGQTGIQEAIDDGWRLFGTEVGGTSNGFESLRQVIDVSGDGACNHGNCNGGWARNAALTAGVDAINGLVINPNGESGLLTYYQNNVRGGTNAFVEVADSFADFGDAVQRKLIREISNDVPEPGILGLMGLGLLGLLGTRRRKA